MKKKSILIKEKINEENIIEPEKTKEQKLIVPECAEMIPVITSIIENVVDLIGDIEPDWNDLMTAHNNLKTARFLVDAMIIDIEKQLKKLENESERNFKERQAIKNN